MYPQMTVKSNFLQDFQRLFIFTCKVDVHTVTDVWVDWSVMWIFKAVEFDHSIIGL